MRSSRGSILTCELSSFKLPDIGVDKNLSSQLEVPFCFDLAAQKAELWDGGDVKFSTSTRERIGDAVAAVLTHPEETENKIVYVNSFTITQNQLLASLEKASGKKWEVTRVKSGEEMEKGKEMLKSGNMMGIGPIVKGICFAEGWGSDFEGEGVELMNEVLGLGKEDFDEVVDQSVNNS